MASSPLLGSFKVASFLSFQRCSSQTSNFTPIPTKATRLSSEANSRKGGGSRMRALAVHLHVLGIAEIQAADCKGRLVEGREIRKLALDDLPGGCRKEQKAARAVHGQDQASPALGQQALALLSRDGQTPFGVQIEIGGPPKHPPPPGQRSPYSPLFPTLHPS